MVVFVRLSPHAHLSITKPSNAGSLKACDVRVGSARSDRDGRRVQTDDLNSIIYVDAQRPSTMKFA
jgi:hypothetical protein